MNKKYNIFLPWPFLEVPIVYRNTNCMEKNQRLGVNLYFKQALEKNDRVNLVNNFEDADYIFYINHTKSIDMFINYYSSLNYKIDLDLVTKIKDHKEYNKEIIIDYTDFTSLHSSRYSCNSKKNIKNSYLVFKRSTVNKKIGHIKYEREVNHISWAISEECLKYVDNKYPKKYDISCMFNKKNKKHRLGLRGMIMKYLQKTDLKNKYNIFLGEKEKLINCYSQLNLEYFKQLQSSKIIITCDMKTRYNGEGDLRLFEALCSGTLVFSGKMITPIINPLIHKKHLIYFNSIQELDILLRYYLNNPLEAEKIAIQGKDFVLKNHTFRNRINQILDHIEKK